MTTSRQSESYDVAVIGAGPVGCASALALAGTGRRVLLLEQDPLAVTERMVGEWLHPPAMDVLEGLGVELTPPLAYPTGKGFVVCPDDGSEPIVLPYASGRFGFSLEHGLLVETLRAHAERHDGIEYVAPARALRVEGGALTFEHRGGRARTVRAERVVGATGGGPRPIARGEVLTFTSAEARPTHRIAGVTLRGAELPFEGYLHLYVGGAGPAMAYRVGPSSVRLLLDVPLSARVPRDGGVALYEAFAPALPASLAAALRDSLRTSAPVWCFGELRPRTQLVSDGVSWIGDAAGSYHPLTAIDLTLGLGDAVAVARARTPYAYRRDRKRRTRVQESIAVGLHELLADSSPETVALRRAVYRLWRANPRERLRTMGFVAGDGEGTVRFGRSCLRVMTRGAADVLADGARSGALRHSSGVYVDLIRRIGWMVGGSIGWTEALPRGWEERLGLRGAGRYGAALSSAEVRGEVVGLPAPASTAASSIAGAIERAASALASEQADDGSFEGEVALGPVLAAKYVLAMHALERPIGALAAGLARTFDRARLPSGGWAAGARGEADLGATVLIYAASRLLGLAKDDPRIAGAHALVRMRGGALAIDEAPRSLLREPAPIAADARAWLALAGLFEWSGVRVPAASAAPRWIAPRSSEPAQRSAAIAIQLLASARHHRAPTPTVRALRDELFLAPYEEIDFAASVPRSLSERALARLPRGPREGLGELRERLRSELRSSSHAGLSPESALLAALALCAHEPSDADAQKALERLAVWIWEDEDGVRVAPARSATLDTALAAQALAAGGAEPDALARAEAYLATQQVRAAARDAGRVDPMGGWCEAGAWHGWPDATATAEVMLARLATPAARPSGREMLEAARFLLRLQSRDGSFGAFEPRSFELGLPARDAGGVERTAACVLALSAFRARWPEQLASEIDAAVERAITALRRSQRPDGSWRGGGGVCFLHGTMLGVRGLVAGGVPAVDPQVRRACAWLKERQRADGGWGEHPASCAEDRYVEHEESQVVQTAWALIALCEADDPDFGALERAAAFLARAQRPDGTWERQDPVSLLEGVLVERRSYAACFPLRALGRFQQRAQARALVRPRSAGRPSPDRFLH